MLRDATTKLETSRISTLTGAGECAVEFIKARPEVRLKRWNGEAELGFRVPGINATLEDLGNEKVRWGNGAIHVEAYTLPAGEGMEDGGLEFEVILNSKPPVNSFSFNVDRADEFDWYLQPALTQREINSGRFRPDNVVGSYAVYHKAKRDHANGGINYGTGKAFHIYRPKLIDANGVETWGTLSYENGVLTVSIPQKALDDAAYPARVDPTFGYTGVAASTYAIGADFIEGTKGTPASAGTVDSVTVYVQGSATNAKAVMVLASNLNIITNGVSSAASISGAPTWQTINYSVAPSVSAATAYYVCVIYQTADLTMYYDSTGDGDLEDTSNSYTTPTNPTDGTEVANERYSLYASYTASGGGKVTKNTRSNPLGLEVGMGFRIH